MPSQQRLLAVFAHPDDECYGPGGTIASLALRGVDIYILMFTCGDAGSLGVSKTLPGDELCRRRTIEMQRACDALGVRSHRMLGVPDKGVGDVDREWAIGEILADIARFTPQVVLTFHHRGVSSHPDHIAVASYLDEAFARSGAGGPQKYYEWAIPEKLSMLYQRPNLAAVADDEITAVVPVDDEAMDAKLAAIRSHETQIEFFNSLNAAFDYRTVARPEYFVLRRTRLARPDRVEDDFFADIGETK